MDEHDTPKTIWPALNYKDARAAIDFLVALGFTQTAAHTDDADRIVHAELRWPEGGGLMLGDAGRADSEFSQLPTGCASVYVVTDAPDPVHERAVAAGADIFRELTEQDYGSREFALRDPEGNLFSFGTYRGA